MEKIFFVFSLLSVLLLNELCVPAKETMYEANPQKIKQDISKKDKNLREFDGKKWKALSFEQKSSFYSGYELGRIMTVERIDDLKELLQNAIDIAVSQEIKKEFMNLQDGLDVFSELLEKYDTVVAQKEMVRLVDKFYDDPANLNIRLHHAFVINKLIKVGASARAIKNLIDLYRKKDKDTGGIREFFLLGCPFHEPQEFNLQCILSDE